MGVSKSSNDACGLISLLPSRAGLNYFCLEYAMMQANLNLRETILFFLLYQGNKGSSGTYKIYGPIYTWD